MNMSKLIVGISAVLIVVFHGFSVSAWARVDCSTLPHWITLDNNLRMNQKHLFCGEWDRNRPKGFHSRFGGANPNTVATFTVQDKANAAGVYTGRWSHQDNPHKNKFSSMFPDNCSAGQVLNSIAYAIENPAPCPEGAPNWTHCGANKPDGAQTDAGVKYCSVDGRLFTIGYAPPKNGRVNTAFPFYQ